MGMVHSLLLRIAADWHALQSTDTCWLGRVLLVGSTSCELQCLLGFIVYWAAMPTSELHGLLAGFTAYWTVA